MAIALAAWEVPYLIKEALLLPVTQALSPAAAAGGMAQIQLGAIDVVDELVSWLLAAPGLAIAIALADRVLRGDRPTARDALQEQRRTLSALRGAVGGTFLAFVLLALSLLAAAALFVVTLFGIVGVLVAGVCLLIWWRNPRARGSRLRRAIVLTTPLGVPVYYFVLWSLVIPAAVLERRGPRSALARSAELVRSHWFKTLAVMGVITLLGAVILREIPWAIAGGALYVTRGINPFGTTPLPVQFLESACESLGWALFAGIISAGSTLLFVDLRNRREGADLGERIRLLGGEAHTAPETA